MGANTIPASKRGAGVEGRGRLLLLTLKFLRSLIICTRKLLRALETFMLEFQSFDAVRLTVAIFRLINFIPPQL